MIILGIGSNLGFQLDNLRTAVKLLGKVEKLSVKKVSPIYQSQALLPDNAPAQWNRTFLNLAIACECALTPLELLQRIKEIEVIMGRLSSETWSPRVIDIDILAWDSETHQYQALQIPHPELCNRPFALWPLLDLAPNWQHPLQDISHLNKLWGTRYEGNAPLETLQIPHRVDTPALVGILNLTPNSFSDDGLFNNPELALAHAQNLFAAGAEIIDIGAESTRPGAVLITAEQEWAQLEPVLQLLLQQQKQLFFKPKISIDTRHPQTAAHAIRLGVDWINDVTGFENEQMCEVVVNTPVQCVFMHSLGVPPSQRHVLADQPSVAEQILLWAKERIAKLLSLGVKTEQLIFDPGIGFGKTPQQSLEIIKTVVKFHELNTPLLIGHSRKSFLTQFGVADFNERDVETSILSSYLASHAVDYLRVHNVAMNVRALRVVAELRS